MRIVNICLTGPFTEGMLYQDNLLTDIMKKKGHQVYVIAPAIQYNNGFIQKTLEETRITSTGINLIRLNYRFMFSEFITNKVRSVKGLMKLLISLNPDLIYVHGMQTIELITVKRYVKKFKKKLIADSHEDFYNSAKNLLSKYILHKVFYKILIRLSLKYIDRIYFISVETKYFLKKIYNINTSSNDFLPLGGLIFNDDEYERKRAMIRSKMLLNERDLVFLHSGKLDTEKKTVELVREFHNNPSPNFILWIAGNFMDSEEKLFVESIINEDNRIIFLGWKSGSEIIDLLLACDIYVQPGSQSATLQMAACLNNVIICKDYENYINIFDFDSVLWLSEVSSISSILKKISSRVYDLDKLRISTMEKAKLILDYNSQVDKIIANYNLNN